MAENQEELKPENKLSAEELKPLIDEDKVVIVDVRFPDEIERSGRIESRRWINIPYCDLDSTLKLSENEFLKKFGIEKIKNDGDGFVFHCGKGGRGTKATNLVLKLGYKRVKHLEDGQSNWKRFILNVNKN